MLPPTGVRILGSPWRRDFHVVMDFDDSRHFGDAGLRKLFQMVRRHAAAQVRTPPEKSQETFRNSK